jgi:type I restriction-modification system DNA methylase subunit
MNASQIEKKVVALVEDFNKEEFVFDLLKAYGISKTSITRLKKGDFNLSKVEGELLYKSKLLFKEVASGDLLDTIDELTKEPDALKHSPRFVIVTDYSTLLAKDIRTGLTLDTPILKIHKHFSFFLPWAGQEKYAQKNENYADRKASYKMAKLYDILVTENPTIYEDGGHNLNIFLSRLLFCFFAEDTDIFPIEGMFTDTLAQHTAENGSDVNTFLDNLFNILNTKDNTKEASHFSEFPYVNGGLFRDAIVSPKFTKEARNIIIECGDLDWSEINPDIFGSMIQAVVNPAYRSGLGMHYTSVPNIMKVIEPLFLNELYDEFEKYRDNAKKLRQLIFRISKLKIFDPACGSGNFLIIAYKELRKLEIQIWQQINDLEPQYSFVFTEVKLSQFYGIELDDFAHEMAILSLWLAEHQMNKVFVDELFDFGKAKPILPLKEAGNITQGNATRLNWNDTCPKNDDDEIYILGNPPYLGYGKQNTKQKEDLKIVFANIKSYKKLDYISCWFMKAAVYIKNYNIAFAFVTTNSITQGEQVSLLWPNILNKGLEIFFAYQSFKWTNNAKGNAGVSVVIIGIRNISNSVKHIYDSGLSKIVDNINPYLTQGENIIVQRRNNPLSNFPIMMKGSQPTDGGNLLLTKEEKAKLELNNPILKGIIKRYYGAKEYIRDDERFCLWIEEIDLKTVIKIDAVNKRLDAVQVMRESSTKTATNQLAEYPHMFGEIRYFKKEAIIVPTITSERRDYIPCGFIDANSIISNTAQAIYDFPIYLFGIISSTIMLTWIKAVGGKFKTDYIVSSSICYNTFPFPEINQKQKEQINLHVFEVLEEREKHSGKTLAQLYDPDKMPKGLKEAHHQLDLAIERCYRLKPFESDTERLEYLFKEYEKMINQNTLLEKSKKTRKKK